MKRLALCIVRSGNPIKRPPEGRSLRDAPSVNGTQNQNAFSGATALFGVQRSFLPYLFCQDRKDMARGAADAWGNRFSDPCGRREKTLPSPALGRERSNTSWCHPISAAVRPFLLLLREACRGCFHPRSSAVLARPAAVRFQPAAHLSAGGVARVTPAKSTRSLFIIGDFLPVVKAVQAVKGLLLGFTMSRQSR